MHGTRLATLVASLVCALLIGGVGTASAAQSAAVPMAKKIPITGQASNGKKIKNATFKIEKFSKRNGKVYADGVVRGTFKGRSFKRSASVPVKKSAVASGAKSSQLLPPIPNSCQVLNLVLGPINLNLLGLVVRTNQINVAIDAVPGAGNLLGNLLCGITNALNPGGLTGSLQQIVNILNALLALAPSTA